MVDYFTERVISQPGTFVYHKISLDKEFATGWIYSSLLKNNVLPA
jgi:hypothetical protein